MEDRNSQHLVEEHNKDLVEDKDQTKLDDRRSLNVAEDMKSQHLVEDKDQTQVKDRISLNLVEDRNSQ